MSGFLIPGDLELSADGSRFVFRQGLEEYADRVRAALHIFRGTWWYDQTRGIRYLDVILEKPASIGLPLLQSEVRRVIAETQGTLAVTSVTARYDPSERRAWVAWTARTRYGTTSGEEALT
jgi:hypothetical protein